MLIFDRALVRAQTQAILPPEQAELLTYAVQCYSHVMRTARGVGVYRWTLQAKFSEWAKEIRANYDENNRKTAEVLRLIDRLAEIEER